MALGATLYTFDISLNDVDRDVYETFTLRPARHPTETPSYLITRVLAYCLEYQEGIIFTKGLGDGDEPAIWSHDPTGQILLWCEIGTPKADRLHRASKLGAKVVVYVNKDAEILLSQLRGEKIFGKERIKIFGFDPDFLNELEPLVERRSLVSITVSEQELYITINGKELRSNLLSFSL